MKSADLKPGTDYAYQPDRGGRHWSPPPAKRVTVLEVGVTGHDMNARGWRVTNVAGLIKIAYATGAAKGETLLVRPQTLTRTWSEEHAARVQAGKQKAEFERQEQTERQRRAHLAFTMHQRLVAAGAPVAETAVYDDEDYEALVKAGFHKVPHVEHFFENSLFSAVDRLSDLAHEGTVALDDVAVLLGLEEPKVDEYSGLGCWDSEGFDPEDWTALETAHADAVSDAKVGA